MAIIWKRAGKIIYDTMDSGNSMDKLFPLFPVPKKTRIRSKESAKSEFSLPILGVFTHSLETKVILEKYIVNRKASDFLRKSIIDYSEKRGFSHLLNGASRPDYVPLEIWEKIVAAQNKSYYVDFSYIVAFYWLMSLSENEEHNKSSLLREMIVAYG